MNGRLNLRCDPLPSGKLQTARWQPSMRAYTDSRVAVCCEFCSHNVSDVTDTCGVASKLGPFAGSNLCTKVGKTVGDETSRKCKHL